MGDETVPATSKLVPFALKDAPTLIESIFTVEKISFEAQTERKALIAQLLTRLSSYWKGRKPLILVRAIVLGCLLFGMLSAVNGRSRSRFGALRKTDGGRRGGFGSAGIREKNVFGREDERIGRQEEPNPLFFKHRLETRNRRRRKTEFLPQGAVRLGLLRGKIPQRQAA